MREKDGEDTAAVPLAPPFFLRGEASKDSGNEHSLSVMYFAVMDQRNAKSRKESEPCLPVGEIPPQEERRKNKTNKHEALTLVII